MAVKKKASPKAKALNEEVSEISDEKEAQENQTVNSQDSSIEEKPIVDSSNETLDSTPVTGSSQNSPGNNEEKTSIEKEFWDEEKEKKSSFGKVILFFLLFILIAGIIGAVGFFSYQFAYKKGVETGEKNAKEKLASQIPTKTPTPTAEEEVKLSEYSIEVLNGSGINGEASKLKSVLEDEGYTVSDIGNTEKDYEKTIIQAKSDVSKAWLNKLKKTLEKSYTLDDTLPLDKGDNDVIISIGSLKKE